MDNTLNITQSVEVHAPATEVWKGLTEPELIKQYFFGTEMETSWEKGAPIFWRGVWEGKEYEEKGEVLEIDEGNSVSMSYLTAGLEDIPENYSVITFEIETLDDEFSKLTVTQEGFRNQEACDHSQENWKIVLDGLRKVVENQTDEQLS
ncbi:SRPBCC domain-containing protein [Flavobacterium sp. MAH-1]|uniref:SRPBCC domain-containing protein n=1 Tax=Flavobacterium agri TaxID=2743471 RepID=A0A7Y8Y7T0_9FLAO|nr:SRPBCC family protein [Flavobacterium agri]NUY82657.1 SRPBCC domain-containing protein [Flavobacterium agri]NYA72680.1 SRPBCC domain-containing protein [Flavobacterium agri]